MKKIYDYIIYSLLALIIIVSIILFLPSGDNTKKVNGFTLDVKNKSLEIDKSGSKKIEATSNGEILYRSYNPLVAIVTKSGAVIGIGEGETKVEVSTQDGNIKEYISVVVKKKSGAQDVNPGNITIVGDSRMVGLCSYKWYKNDNGTCIAKVSMGYSWLVSTAIPEVLKKYKELATGSWKNSNIFLLSINPTKGGYDNLNNDIDSFNSKLKSFAKSYDNVIYCDSVNYLRNNGFGSSDGLHYNEDTSKIIYSQIKKCIYDFYN